MKTIDIGVLTVPSSSRSLLASCISSSRGHEVNHCCHLWEFLWIKMPIQEGLLWPSYQLLLGSVPKGLKTLPTEEERWSSQVSDGANTMYSNGNCEKKRSRAIQFFKMKMQQLGYYDESSS